MSFSTCKNDTKTNSNNLTQEHDLVVLKGDFIYYADAAVLQTSAEVYGVVIDKNMHELDKQVQPYKKQATDMVPVEIKGKIISKPEHEEGWPFRVEIKEIIHISNPNLEDNNKVILGK